MMRYEEVARETVRLLGVCAAVSGQSDILGATEEYTQICLIRVHQKAHSVPTGVSAVRLFGRDAKRLPTGHTELVQENQEIIRFFELVMQGPMRSGSDYLLTLLLGAAAKSIVSGSLCLDGITKAMPLSLCFLRQAGYQALGLVDPISIGDVEEYLRDTGKAARKSIDGFDCWNLTVGQVDYPFFMMSGDRVIDISRVPRNIMIITDRPQKELKGIGRDTKVMKESTFLA